MTDGGDGATGTVITPEGRARRRVAQQKSFADPQRRARHLNNRRGAMKYVYGAVVIYLPISHAKEYLMHREICGTIQFID